MTLHKLTAGDGYTYLTRQVARGDVTPSAGQSMADYYTEKGERPGQWLGGGLGGLDGVSPGEMVTEDQMKSLFGHGMHPNARALGAAYLDQETDAGRIEKADVAALDEQAQAAGFLGQPYRLEEADPSNFLVAVSRRYNAYNAHPQQRQQYWEDPHEEPQAFKKTGEEITLPVGARPRGTAVPERVRETIRTQVGRETFQEKHGRPPFDARELSGHITRESRRGGMPVAGYDLTFSPVKSVSTLWALAPREVSERIEKAHEVAVRDTIAWAEQHVIFTRRGKRGVRQVDVTGVLATAFVHRDSRAGDPDLHTHVAIANKVQDPTDGKWLAIDGRTLHKMTVACSERYDTLLERELRGGLGLDFIEVKKGGVRRAQRPTREIAGVDQELMSAFSQRRATILETKQQLVGAFQEQHGRAPTPKELGRLGQQANLDTREDKHEPRSLAEQRQAWRVTAEGVLGGPRGVERMLERVRGRRVRSTKRLSDRQLDEVADDVLERLRGSRAQFQTPHVIAEAQRRVRARNLDPEVVETTIDAVVARVLDPVRAVAISRPDPVAEPDSMRRGDGASVYETAHTRLFTTQTILDAEAQILAAAQRTDGRVVSAGTVTDTLLHAAMTGPALNPAQAQMVDEMATSGARVQLGLAPAGSGKTTAMRALAAAWEADGGTVIGFAPSAVASTELGRSVQAQAYSLDTLTFSLKTGVAMPKRLAEVDANTLFIIDEAGMAGTENLALAIDYVLSRGGSVRLIGDDQQLGAIAAGGVLQDLATRDGACTLSELHRFQNPEVGAAEGAATLALRAGLATEALGFYLDNGRIRVGGQDTLADQVYQAWTADCGDGRTSLMMAFANETVTGLNGRARADRLAADGGQHGRPVALASGLEASAGDVLITRKNDRRLRITGTDFVKNGDRWTLQKVHRNGSLTVRHQKLGRTVTLPAEYAAENVDLGYASTYHGAQGQTVDTTHCLLTGMETRQLLYVGASRGRYSNTLYVPSGGDGDEHGQIYPQNTDPATAVEFLEEIIAHDDTRVSAHTQLRNEADPCLRLTASADRYQDALGHAATSTVGPERMAELASAANTTVAGVTDEAAWDTLAGHLAILQLQGRDPIAALDAAAR